MTRVREATGGHYSTLPEDREARLASGTRVADGRMHIEDELGRGGMAVVYRGRDLERDGTPVAIKVATAGADPIETSARYHNEARLGASLDGESNLVRPLFVGTLAGPRGFEGRNFLVTELIDGEPLSEVMLAFPTGIPIHRVRTLGADVARALAGLHGRGIVHRDIKPANIVVERTAAGERARLIDFGLAYATGDGWESRSPDLTEEGYAPGTPIYMSPQQAAHERPSPAFDIYSLGATLYELVSGNPPHEGVPLDELMGRKCDPSCEPFSIGKIRPDTPPALASLIDRCLAYEAGARPSATQIVAALQSASVANDARRPGSRGASPEQACVPAPAAPVAALAPTRVGVRPAAMNRRWTRWYVAMFVGAAVTVAAWAWAARPRDSPQVVAAGIVLTSPGTAPVMRIWAPRFARLKPPAEPARSTAARTPRPVASTRSRAKPDAESSMCDAQRAAARRAHAGGNWGAAVERTNDDRCWQGASLERRRLRVEGLMHLKRYKACAAEAFKSSDPQLLRVGEQCYRRAESASGAKSRGGG